jgi:hypothetical protein
MQFFIIDNSNYSIEYLERTTIFEIFKISKLVEGKIQAKIEAQDRQIDGNVTGVDS